MLFFHTQGHKTFYLMSNFQKVLTTKVTLIEFSFQLSSPFNCHIIHALNNFKKIDPFENFKFKTTLPSVPKLRKLFFDFSLSLNDNVLSSGPQQRQRIKKEVCKYLGFLPLSFLLDRIFHALVEEILANLLFLETVYNVAKNWIFTALKVFYPKGTCQVEQFFITRH